MATISPTISEPQSPEIQLPEEWSDAANTIADASFPPVSLICGPKDTGKSTFSRYLLNLLLLRYERVAYLDTDIGQPEFTPPGCLSLTIIDQATPDFTIPYLKTPERCYFFGDVSSKRNPEGYMNCVTALHDHYRKEQSPSRNNGISIDVPLIINTPGWVKGIGFDILVDMMKLIAPTHVVKINISDEFVDPKQNRIKPKDKNLPEGLFWFGDDGVNDDCSSVNLFEITSACKDSSDRPVLVRKEARLIREQGLVDYFRQCFSSDANVTTTKELAHALASHIPYQVPLSRITIRHLHCKVPSTEILYSLNGTIVGLALSPDDFKSLPVCVGLGIVRGIDISKNLLYVITPVQRSILARVDILLQGLIEIPTNLLQVQGCISPYMAANVLPEASPKKSKKRRSMEVV